MQNGLKNINFNLNPKHFIQEEDYFGVKAIYGNSIYKDS